MERELVDLQDFVKEIARLYGERAAYKFSVDDKIVEKTYLDLEKDSMAIASWFVQKGWHGKHIAVLGGTSYE